MYTLSYTHDFKSWQSTTTVTLASEKSTELSKGPEVVSSRFRTDKYSFLKTELPKSEVVSPREFVSSRYKILEYCLLRIKILK